MISERVRAALFGLSGVLAAALLVPASPGCGERDEPPGMTKKAIALEKIPKAVNSAAAKTLRGVKIGEAWENIDREGKLRSYEIRGKVPSTGKIREVRVDPSGKVLEVE
jgi:hypothetical protein